MGHRRDGGGGDPSLDPAEVDNFYSRILFEKKENKQKEAGDGPFLFLFNANKCELKDLT